MGYDHKVHLVAIHVLENEKAHFAERLMTIELCGMADGFNKLFDRTVDDFYFFGGNGDKAYGYDPYKDEHYEDSYGDKMTYTTDIKSVVGWLKNAMEDSKNEYHGHPYRRETMLYNVLKNFKMYDWRGTTIALVHEGH